MAERKKVSQKDAAKGLAAAMEAHNKKYATKGASKLGEKPAQKFRRPVTQREASQALAKTTPTKRVRG